MKRSRRVRRNNNLGRSSGKVGLNAHHIFWSKYRWDSMYQTKKLRDHPYCRAPLKTPSLHDQLHEVVKFVPTPRNSDAKLILSHLDWLYRHGGLSDRDNIITRLDVLIGIIKSAQVAKPTMDALIQQKEFLEKIYYAE